MKKDYFYVKIDITKNKLDLKKEFDILLTPRQESNYLTRLAKQLKRKKYTGYVELSNKYGEILESIYF